MSVVKKLRELSVSAIALMAALMIPQVSLAESAEATAETADNQQTLNRPVKDKWALIIGISQFKDNTLNLRFPAKDATDFRDFLIKNANFAPDHVKVLTNQQATRENILDELGDKWLPRVCMPDDLVVVYLSTHGSPSEADVGSVNYLLAYDTNKDKLYSTGIAMQDFCRIIKARIHSDRTLVILDACHSGATSPEGKGIARPANADAEEIMQGTGQMVICSSQPSQASWESKSAQNSVFTRRLMEALSLNGERTTLGTAFNFLKDKVQEDVLRERGQMQTPVLKSKWSGNDLELGIKPVTPRQGLNDNIVASVPATVTRTVETPQTKPSPIASIAVNSTRGISRVEQNNKTSPAPVVATGPSVSNPNSNTSADARMAETALRDHFKRMAYSSPTEAYNDFTEAIKKMTPFARYQVNVRKQNYVASVSNMPSEAFRLVSASSVRAEILVNEKWITGLDVLWRYSLTKVEGKWLISGFKKITPAEWNFYR